MECHGNILKLRPALFVIAFALYQHVFAQQAQSDITPQPLLTNSVQEALNVKHSQPPSLQLIKVALRA